MAHSGRPRHRDRDAGRRDDGYTEKPSPFRAFRMTDAQRQEIARCLRGVDTAREDIETRHDPANREILRTLRASADRIFDVLNELEEIEP